MAFYYIAHGSRIRYPASVLYGSSRLPGTVAATAASTGLLRLSGFTDKQTPEDRAWGTANAHVQLLPPLARLSASI